MVNIGRRVAVIVTVALLAGLGACGAPHYSVDTLPQLPRPAASDSTPRRDRPDKRTRRRDVAEMRPEDLSTATTDLRNAFAERATAILRGQPVDGQVVPTGGAVTLLMPTPAAFAALSPETAWTLLTRPRQLDRLVEDHLLVGVLMPKRLAGMPSVQTLGGLLLQVQPTGRTVRLGDALVVDASKNLPSDDTDLDLALLAIDHVLVEPS